MGKSQIKSYCQNSNQSINRLKSFSQISNPIFPQISNLLVTNLTSNLKFFNFLFFNFCLHLLLIFHNIKNNVILYSRSVISDQTQLLQYSQLLKTELHASERVSSFLTAHQHITGYFSALQWCEYCDKSVKI